MTPYVVDSSVIVKWYVPELLTVEALRVRDGPASLHAPDFVDVEIGNILWKKLGRGHLTRAAADAILADLMSLPILTRHPSGPLVIPAFDLAVRTGRTVYDCLYLALAVQLAGVMVTADDKLVNALASTAWASRITKLQDVP